jgi:xanthine dehydrogenase accessory factor
MSSIYDTLKQQLVEEKGTALATVVRGPAHLGSKLLVLSDKTVLGTLGNPMLDELVLPDAGRSIWKGEAYTRTYTLDSSNETEPQSFDVFIEGYAPPPSLIIVGAGHIAIALTTFAKTLNYHVTIIDARSAFATRERFPNADDILVEWPDEILERMDLNPSVSIAVLTHDPKFDEPTLEVVLKKPLGYIGAIGSRKTSEERAERLKQRGLTDEQLSHIHAPIGLNLGGRAPEEIALAIMAEIVATRNSKDETAIKDWSRK